MINGAVYRISRREALKRGFCAALAVGAGLRLGRPTVAGHVEAAHYRKLGPGPVECGLCFRRCVIPDGGEGFCRNRRNMGGTLYALTADRICSIQIDPIEKEPVFHMLPGTDIFCTAAAGCNFRCRFCQNWQISQSRVEDTNSYDCEPADIVSRAKRRGCPTLSFTYSEPTVFYEYMRETARLGKERGLKAVFHTNGSISAVPLVEILDYMDAVTVDLKGFTEKFYNSVSSASLGPVMKTLEAIRRSGRHLEIVNLVIPTLNDDLAEIKKMCRWIKAELGENVPLHFNRFYPAYRLKNIPPTPVSVLEDARQIAIDEGINYVYIGNVPGHKYNSTFCPRCGSLLIDRVHFVVSKNRMREGKCPSCGLAISGIWN